MKTLEQIKDEVAVDHGFKNYFHVCELFRDNVISQFSFDDYIDDTCKEYTQQCCHKLRQDCADKAIEMMYFLPDDPNIQTIQIKRVQVVYAIDKQSILTTKIELP